MDDGYQSHNLIAKSVEKGKEGHRFSRNCAPPLKKKKKKWIGMKKKFGARVFKNNKIIKFFLLLQWSDMYLRRLMKKTIYLLSRKEVLEDWTVAQVTGFESKFQYISMSL